MNVTTRSKKTPWIGNPPILCHHCTQKAIELTEAVSIQTLHRAYHQWFLLKKGRKRKQFLSYANPSGHTMLLFRKNREIQLLMLNITALGFRPETHSIKYSLQLNYSLLPKWKKHSPKFAHFLRLF